jgi:putative transposase
MLAQAIDAEVAEWIDSHAHLTDERGHRQVVRNGYLPQRTITTGVGSVDVQQPRVLDRRCQEEAEPFSSKILPPYLRKTKSVEELIPWLYLKGISTGDFSEALQALVGPRAAGLSASTVTRLKQTWEQGYDDWSRRCLEGKEFVYVWADGIHFNVRLEEDRQCILVLMGATAEGHKELIALTDGYRESEQSWLTLLVDVKQRGLKLDPKLATGDGALGFWKALAQVFPLTKEQRCWVHKTANVLDKLPKRLQPAAKEQLHQIWMAEKKVDAQQAFDTFLETYQAKYPKAVECLQKDREVLLAFYDFPAEHWIHLRTTNPIESTFATVRSPRRHQRQRHSQSVPHDGLQTDGVSRQTLAALERITSLARRRRRSSVHRRYQIPTRRRLKNSNPQLIAISPLCVAAECHGRIRGKPQTVRLTRSNFSQR